MPLEVQDLKDEIEGYETRIQNYTEEIKNLEKQIVTQKNVIEEAHAKIAKNTELQNNVRNNREYDSLSKEIEFQKLEIAASDKKIKEYRAAAQDIVSLNCPVGTEEDTTMMEFVSDDKNIEEMFDAELLSLILKQFEGLEYLFQHMCTRTLCHEFEKLTSDEK